LVTAGVPGPHVVTTIISSVVHEPRVAIGAEPSAQRELLLDVGGLITATEENVDWARVPLKIGDSITIDLIDTTTVDEPKNRRTRENQTKIVPAVEGARLKPVAVPGQSSKRPRKPK